MNTQEPKNTVKISYGLLAGLAALMHIIVFFSSAIAYTMGYSQGKQEYIHNNCTAYPFLLLPSNQYWACRIPTDMQILRRLQEGGQ